MITMKNSLNFKSKKRKAQAWSLDFIVGLVIFAAAIIFYFIYSGDVFNYPEADLDELRVEASSISSALMTPGYPPGWNSSNVIRIGISEDGSRISWAKLQNLNEIALNYSRMKYLLKVRNDFQITITDDNSSIIFSAGLNKSSKLETNSERIVLLNNSPCKLQVRTFKV